MISRVDLDSLVSSLKDILGPNGWVGGSDALPQHRDWLGRYGVAPIGLARPCSTVEVSSVMAVCHAAGVVVVPQGGNTGLCGAAVVDAPNGVILSLSRMAAIGKVDCHGGSIEVEAGVVLANLHETLDGTGHMFPLHLGSEGSAQIGGLISTNAGGSHAFRFGMMQDLVLGLEVVLADGSVWNGMRSVQKDNAGYQLRRLFCGAEGTLGIVTRAVLRLHVAPTQRVTALLALPDEAAAVALCAHARKTTGEFLTALEFFSETGLALALKHIPGLRHPLETRSGCYLLIEAACGSARIPLAAILEDFLEDGMTAGLVLDGTLAASEAQRSAFWRLREEQPEGQRLEGLQLKNDISVPPARIADFIRQSRAICEALLPGVRINPFGHLGDGNIHYNLTPAEGQIDFAGQAGEVELQLARLATDMGGSFAAEHGLGRSKIGLADTLRPEVERRIMRTLKASFDPAARLNPGVILRAL